MADDVRDVMLGRVAAAVSGLCVLVLAVTVLAFSGPTLAERFGWTEPAASYRLGERIDVAPSVYGGASRTIVFFARATCGACQASKATIARVVDDIRSVRGVQTILMTGKARGDEEVDFAREVGLAESGLVQTDLGSLRLRYVPTTVVVDNRGTILFAREGLLTDSDRQEIVQMARAPLTE